MLKKPWFRTQKWCLGQQFVSFLSVEMFQLSDSSAIRTRKKEQFAVFQQVIASKALPNSGGKTRNTFSHLWISNAISKVCSICSWFSSWFYLNRSYNMQNEITCILHYKEESLIQCLSLSVEKHISGDCQTHRCENCSTQQ